MSISLNELEKHAREGEEPAMEGSIKTEALKEILKHYHIPKEEIDDDRERNICFCYDGSEEVALGEFVKQMCKTQQTIIDYDEDYGVFVVRMTPMNYGNRKDIPKVYPSKGFEGIKRTLRTVKMGKNCAECKNFHSAQQT